MSQSTLPIKEAHPLIKLPKEIPQIGFFGGEQGREINDSIRGDYVDFAVLQIGDYSKGVIEGSNSFYVVAVGERLPAGVSVATQANLEYAMTIDAMDFRRIYVDTGLVLRTEEPNSYLARNLMEQVKARGRKKMPVMIPLKGCTLERDQSSPCGLSFKLKEDAEIIYSRVLNKEGNFSSTDINSRSGLPEKLNGGNRFFWSRTKGLSRLYLGRYLNFVSGCDDLADSGGDGRVVIVSAGGASQK